MRTRDKLKPMGSLYDDLAHVARRVHQVTGEHAVIVWADESGTVRAVPQDTVSDVPQAMLVGVFNDTSSPADIKDDLHALLTERVRGAIVE